MGTEFFEVYYPARALTINWPDVLNLYKLYCGFLSLSYSDFMDVRLGLCMIRAYSF